MARGLEHTDLRDRDARTRLARRHRPYWHELEARCWLGWFVDRDGGFWIARYARRDGGFADERVGRSDEAAEADGLRVLSFEHARRAARNWHARQVIFEASLPPDDSPFNTAGPACGRI